MFIGHFLGYTAEVVTRFSCNKITSNLALCNVVGVGTHEVIVEPLVNSLFIISIPTTITGYKTLIKKIGDSLKTIALRPKSLFPMLRESLSQISKGELCSKILGSIFFGQFGERLSNENLAFSMAFSFLGAMAGEKLYNLSQKIDGKRYMDKIYQKFTAISYERLCTQIISSMIFFDLAERFLTKNIFVSTAFILCGRFVGEEFYQMTRKCDQAYLEQKCQLVEIFTQKKTDREKNNFSIQDHKNIYSRSSIGEVVVFNSSLDESRNHNLWTYSRQ